MKTYKVFWEEWSGGVEEIEAENEDDARRQWAELIGSLHPTREGIEITSVDLDDETG